MSYDQLRKPRLPGRLVFGSVLDQPSRRRPSSIDCLQGMFDKPMLTFNPGWGQNAAELDSFTDVRQIRQQLAEAGVPLDNDSTQDSDAGPASFAITDPDGNPILIDQHR